MSDQENRKPSGLSLLYQAVNFPSELSQPHNLTAVYDAYAVGPSRTLRASGFDATRYGVPILGYSRNITASGLVASLYGNTLIENKNKTVSATLGSQTVFSNPKIYNLKQFVLAAGKDTSIYGKPYLAGGVVWLNAVGTDTSAYGEALVINTTANQDLKPAGIKSPQIPKPIVRPWIVHAIGIYAKKIGLPSVKLAAVFTAGISEKNYGTPTIWYQTRKLSPDGVLSYDTGYPLVFDPTQFIQTPSLITSAIFGDVAVKSLAHFIRTPAINDGDVSVWSVVENRSRNLITRGIYSQSVGGVDVANGAHSIIVESVNPYDFPLPSVGYATREVRPRGLDELDLGLPILNKPPEIAPSSFGGSLVPNVVVTHKVRFIDLVGQDQSIFGGHFAWYRYRNITTSSWLSSKFAEPSVTHGVREIISQGYTSDAYGLAWVSAGSRQLAPLGINDIYPTLHLIGSHRDIKPDGYIATLFGSRITPDSVTIFTQGFTGEYGLAEASLATRYIEATGFITVGQQPADRWGTPKTYNSVQHITQEYDSTSGLTPPGWSEWTLIENRDKQLNATGLSSLRFGYNQVDNNAAPLLPLGISPPVSTRYDVSLIAHGVRYIKPDGLDAPAVSSWLAIYNDARVVAAQGFNDTGLGLAAVKNTRRYYSGVGRFESSEYGEPMISHAIRNISLEPRYAIMPPQINLPVIDVWTKYATFRGFETAAYGTPSLDIRFNIIAPKWAYRYSIGDPYIKNLTPELGLYGHDSNEFGVSSVRTQWRKVYADGDALTLFGLAKIADTKQFIGLRGWQDMVASQKHTVIKTGAPPYSEQKISLDGSYDFENDKAIPGYGIYFDEHRLGVRIPKPGINQNVIYAKGYGATLFGGGRVWSNNIQILAGIAIHNISSNTVVYNKTRRIVLGEDDAIKSEIEVGKPRMSPWTIYAVVEAPEQARRNHTAIHNHYVNSDHGRRGPGVVLGMPKVESTIRSIHTKWNIQSRVGEPVLDLTRRIIAPRSFGVKKVGQPSIPFTDQAVVAYHDKKEPSSILGKPDVVIADRGDKSIQVKGFISQAIGRTNIQLYVRNLYHIGKDSLLMGARKQNDKPYMWQGLRVGAHVPTSIGGGDTSLFGDGMVSLRIRELTLDGWESFISEYDTANFNGRMKVSRPRTQPPQSQRITIDGFVATDYSNADIKFGQYFIRPDGNSDQFRKGGYHA